MDRDTCLSFVRAEGGALAAAARLGLDAECPSCPGWRVRDVVTHTGMIHTWVTTLVSTGSTERLSRRDLPQPPDDEEALAPWFADGLEALVEVLADVEPDRPVWNWSVTREHVASFWWRRMVHETGVHRWDAQCAHGTAQPVDAVAAVDGIEEIFDTIVPTMVVARAAKALESSLGGTLHAHATDVPGEWLVEVEGTDVRVAREHAKGNAAVRAPVSDLYLFLAGRLPATDVETFGDEAVLANWSEISRF